MSKYLASHNSLTYLTPKKFWMKLIRATAKCQGKDLVGQYNNGARIFDIRLSIDKNNNPYLSHGLVEYKGNIISILSDLYNNLNKPERSNVYIQIVNEQSERLDKYFDYCNKLLQTFTDFNFAIIGNKNDSVWKVYFGTLPSEESHVKFWEKAKDGGLIPRPDKYANNNNAKNIQEFNNATNGIWWFDFI